MDKIHTKKSKTIDKILFLLILIVLLGLILRIYHVAVPFSGHQSLKEVQFASMAKIISEEGDIFTSRDLWTGPNNNVFLPSWFVIFSWKIFGESEWAARLPFIIFGLITIIITYLFAIELTNKKRIGLIAAFFTAVSPMMVYFSRNVQGESPLILFSLLSVYFFIKFKKEQKYSYMIFSAISLSLASLCKTNALYLGIFVFLYWLRYKQELKVNFWKVSIFFIISTMPALIYTIYTYFLPFKTYSSASLTSLEMLLNFKEMIFRGVYLVNGVNALIFLFFIIGIYYLFKKKFKNMNELEYISVTWIISYSVFYFLFLNIATVGNNYYLIPYITPIILLASKTFNHILKKNLTKIISLIIITIVSLVVLFVLYSLRHPYYEAGIQISNIVSSKEITLYRVGDPAVCYYANLYCTIKDNGPNTEQTSLTNTTYLSVASTNINQLTKEEQDYIINNFDLLKTIEGEKNILSGRYIQDSRIDKEYLYVRKNLTI